MEDSHKAFLQWMFTERIVDEQDAKGAISKLLSKGIFYAILLNAYALQDSCSQEQMFAFVRPIKDEIRPFDLDLERMYFEGYDAYIWGLVNKNGDAIAQLATSYTAVEVAIFKKIVD